MTSLKYTLIVFIMLTGFGFSESSAQDHKVAYTNIELILAYMPETAQIEKNLSVFEKKLGESIKVKQNYYQQKFSDYLEAEQSGSWSGEDSRSAAEAELKKLEQEIQSDVARAEHDLAGKRSALLQPLMKKLQKAIDEVATEEGYDYVLNNAVGGGVPTILVGENSSDITDEIAGKLGIVIEQ